MMRKTLTAAVALVAFTGSAIPAANADIKFGGGALTGNVGFTSNYLFRGISNSDNHPALQGGLDYTHGTGLYVGTWASSVDFDDGDEASLEWDLYGGYAHTWNGFTFNGKFIYYLYPGVGEPVFAPGDDFSDEYNYWELQGAVAYTIAGANLSAGIAWANDYFGSSGTGIYYQGAASYPIFQYFALEGHVGYQSIDENINFGAPSYWDWSLGVSASYQGLKLGVYYVDTDIGKSDCFGGLNWCESRAIASLTYTF